MNKSSWKTTAMGWGAAVCLVGYHVLSGHPITFEVITTAIGLAGVGTAAKDHSAR